jgi:hypothetical protein
MGTAFGLQCLSGFIVALWPADAGRYPAEAHQAAMAAGLGLQLIALGVFFTPERRVKPAPMAHAVARAMGFGHAPLPIARPVYMPWTYQEELVRRQRAAWRFAATASAVLCVSLAAMLSMAISRPAIALHLIEVSRRMSDRMGDYATPPTPGAGPARAICTDPERGATACWLRGAQPLPCASCFFPIFLTGIATGLNDGHAISNPRMRTCSNVVSGPPLAAGSSTMTSS